MPHSIGGRLTISSIFDGFELLNHQVYKIDLLNEFYIPNEAFDFIVGYGFSAIKFKKENNLKFKTISYFSDVIETSAAGEGFDVYNDCLDDDDNYSFYWDRELTEQAKYKNLFYMPHFVNTEIYKNLKMEKEYDIMFAGRLDSEYRLNLICDLVQALPDVTFAWFAIEKHYMDALSRAENPELIKKIYRGFIDNEKSMNEALNKTKIVINMNSQGVSSLNYRTFQALAAEVLVISDKRDELDLFENLLPTYKDEDDLKMAIEFFLQNDYENITIKCRNIIKKNYNSKFCVEKMLKLINHE